MDVLCWKFLVEFLDFFACFFVHNSHFKAKAVLIKLQEKSSVSTRRCIYYAVLPSAQPQNVWWFLSSVNRYQFILASTWVSLGDCVVLLNVHNPLQSRFYFNHGVRIAEIESYSISRVVSMLSHFPFLSLI